MIAVGGFWVLNVFRGIFGIFVGCGGFDDAYSWCAAVTLSLTTAGTEWCFKSDNENKLTGIF